MRNRSAIIYVVLLVILWMPQTGWAQIQLQNIQKHIHYLSDDTMLGREAGRKGSRKAARYIEKHFKKYGLIAKGESGFRQTFEAKVSKRKVKDSIRITQNIIGLIDNDSPYTIIIGAHYDHLGKGHIGGSKDSLDVGKIHNGADDNASGVAGLLELARHYSQNSIKESYNILFIGFGAEELGLLGSKHFTEHPTVSLDSVHWMLNMDMIGRYEEASGLAIIGYGTSPAFPKIFQGVTSPLNFFTSRDGNGGSDQTSFYHKDIPVLFFHTGGHDDYHRPTDDPHKINYNAMEEILNLEIKILDSSMKQPKMDFQWTN